MSDQNLAAYLLALGSNISFASGSMVFAHYSRTVGVVWMNCFKASVALVAATACVGFLYGAPFHDISEIWPFLLSGFIGLNVADLFLLRSFAEIGASRALMLFGFSPLILGVASRILFNQDFAWFRVVAIFSLIGCLFTFSYEKYRERGRWEVRGLSFAVVGVLLDAVGTLLTRYGFDHAPAMHPLQAHMYRSLGAVLGFIGIGLFWKIDFFVKMRNFSRATWILLLVGSFAGCFLSLALYLTAVQHGHLASISAISVTGPLFAAMVECALERKRPSRYLVVATLLFLTGFWILVLAD